jgi:hypothetical protein
MTYVTLKCPKLRASCCFWHSRYFVVATLRQGAFIRWLVYFIIGAHEGCAVLTLHSVHFLNAKFAKAGLVAEGYSYHIDYHSARLASWVN